MHPKMQTTTLSSGWQSANKGSHVYMYHKTCHHGNVVVMTVQQSSKLTHEREVKKPRVGCTHNDWYCMHKRTNID